MSRSRMAFLNPLSLLCVISENPYFEGLIVLRITSPEDDNKTASWQGQVRQANVLPREKT